ncbi:MAG: glutamyl-tRNA reductase [candidate division Zixibacteria bacterium]|nr:glutamyl-tRNA reductase [candidate division Zixibacteria bacterium]MDH3937494.1 glutamyl-tRNA reductase [candidate division Zixibacteria bacterium]MDH4035103.1 glutamyl-tRNA reductase [candidate division Zixibacteria bacterium]
MKTEFGILGTSIWQQNMSLLERLTINRDERERILPELKTHLGVDELIFLSTCNRVEFIYATSSEAGSSRILHKLIDYFCCNGNKLNFFPNDFYHYSGREAITHLFRTVSSLESLVVGETQITGQFKQAFQDATESGIAGSSLDALARQALVVAKQVKRDTSIGVGAVSMASLASTQLEPILNKKSVPVIALVGSGEMTSKVARYIQEMGEAELLFVNRTLAKAEQLAEQFGGRAVSLADFQRQPEPVAAIVSATAAIEPVFDGDFLNRLKTNDQPIICVDLAIPRDFADVFGHSDNVTLVDIHALKSHVQGNLRQKFVEAGKADEIVRAAVNKFMSDRIEVSLKPIFHDSYQASIELAREAIDDLFANRKSSLPAEEKERVMRLVTRLVGHSAFQPARLLADRLAQSRTELNLSDAPVMRKAAV